MIQRVGRKLLPCILFGMYDELVSNLILPGA